MVSRKGKEKVSEDAGKGKRKWGGGGGDPDKTGRKRKNRGVLQFFDDKAYQVDEDEESSEDLSLDDEDFFDDEFNSEHKDSNEAGEIPDLIIPKQEEMTEEDLEKLLGDRYRPGAGFVSYAEDGYDSKKSIDRDIFVPSAKDPIIWRVKCTVGRERQSAFCLMQKFAELNRFGTKLQIISACAVDHIKGFIFIEAEKQNGIYEACKGISTIYPSKVTAVPNNEISRLLSVRNTSSGISKGMWARVKSGKYKGDLAEVVAVNHSRKKVTVKLIPRIDLKAMAEKFGGGVPAKRSAIPPQRLISSSEIEVFRPLIQFRRDRDTNEMFEIFDGMMLKDGYLYKKIPIDSMTFWGVMPTEDELLKFEPSKKDESIDVQWLSQLFGDKSKKEVKNIKPDKGGGKSEGSSSTTLESNFEVHDLVFIGRRKECGVVLGSEKDDTIKVLKEGSEGPAVINYKPSELKSASFDKKLFHVLDQHSNTLTVNDTVRILDGPLKDRQGVVKKIYNGVLFLFDESQQENDGYTCVKARLCGKVNVSGDPSNEKGCEPGPSGLTDLPSSPKSPLSPKPSWLENDNKNSYTHDETGMFSVGQSLRIRKGPLKGYLCRVLAVRRSDVTVKLDSQQKILIVKSEHLSEVRGKNSAIAPGEESSSTKPFEFLGQDGASDWIGGPPLPTDDNNWNASGSTERASWSSVPSSSFLLSKESGSRDPMDVDAKKDAGDSPWNIKVSTDQGSSWGASASNSKQLDGWGKTVEPQDNSNETLKDDSWGRAAEKWNSGGGDALGKDAAWGQGTVEPQQDRANDSWGKAAEKWNGASDTSGSKVAWDQATVETQKDISGEKLEADSWSKGADKWGSRGNTSGSKGAWAKAQAAEPQKEQSGETRQDDSWGRAADKWNSGGDTSGSKASWVQGKTVESQQDGSGETVKDDSWGRAANKSCSGSDTAGSKEAYGWGKTDDSQMDCWNKPKSVGADGGTSWSKPEGSTSWNKQGESSWNKHVDGSSWNKPDTGSSWKGDSSWNKSSGKSAWGQQSDANAEGKLKGWKDQDDCSKKSDGSGGDQGFGGWSTGEMENKDNTYQEVGWARPKPSDRNSGAEKKDGWASGGSADVSGKDEESAWNRGSVANKDVDKGSGWEATANSNKKSSTWNISKGSNIDSSGWGKPSDANDEAGGWDKEKKANDGNKSSWNTGAATSSDTNKLSGWAQEDNWGSQKASQGNNRNQSVSSEIDGKGSPWKNGNNAEGSSSGGWGQSNWWKSGTSDTGGNMDSTWSSKSNWNSGSGFGNNNNQDDPSGDGGRGGGWRGGRGVRGDRGGFRGRGGSDRGGFGGRGGGRGGFRGRGDRDFGGRSGFDREGFRGRGSFRGRGRGDWNNRGGYSNEDKSNSWNKGSDNNNEGWKNSENAGSSWSQRGCNNSVGQGWGSSWGQSKGETPKGPSWNQGGSDNSNASQGWSSSWGQPKGETSQKGSSWNQGGNDNSNASQGRSSSWGQPKGETSQKASSWNPGGNDNSNASQGWSSSWVQPKGETSQKGSSWNQGGNDNSNASKGWSSSWGKPKGETSQKGNWNEGGNADNANKGWDQPKGEASEERSGIKEATDGGQTNTLSKDEGPSDPWSKAAKGSWADGSSKGGW